MSPFGDTDWSASAPEALARVEIDRQLEATGWLLQHRDELNLAAGSAIAIREVRGQFKLARGTPLWTTCCSWTVEP